MIDPSALTFGLPPCLRIPIAAVDIDAITTYVGNVQKVITGRNKRANALLVKPYENSVSKHPRVNLWKEPLAVQYEERLYPAKQVWVHVDFAGYRKAYQKFGMPPIPEGYFLDHIQNRVAIRLRKYSHPYLRLCPVRGAVNTSGGSDYGSEGMEKEYLTSLPDLSPEIQARAARAISSKIVYADPSDITKMLDILPGTKPLPGVRDTQQLLFPS
jgi:hypothetical protein